MVLVWAMGGELNLRSVFLFVRSVGELLSLEFLLSFTSFVIVTLPGAYIPPPAAELRDL